MADWTPPEGSVAVVDTPSSVDPRLDAAIAAAEKNPAMRVPIKPTPYNNGETRSQLDILKAERADQLKNSAPANDVVAGPGGTPPPWTPPEGSEPVSAAPTPAASAKPQSPLEIALATGGKGVQKKGPVTAASFPEGQGGSVMDAPVSDAASLFNSFKLGLAGLPGLPADIANALPKPAPGASDPASLLVGGIQQLTDRSAEGKAPLLGASNIAQNVLGYDPNMRQVEGGGEIAQFMGASVNPFRVWNQAKEIGAAAPLMFKTPEAASIVATNARALVADAVKNAFQSTAAVAAGDAVSNSIDNPTMKAIAKGGAELATIPVLSFAQPRASLLYQVPKLFTQVGRDAVSAALDKANTAVKDVLKPQVEIAAQQRMAKNILQTGPDATPASRMAGAEYEAAAALQDRINASLEGTGQKVTMTVGQGSNSPVLIADELAHFAGDNATLAARQVEQVKNAQAISTHILQGAESEGSVPSRKSIIDRVVQGYNDTRQALIDQANTLTQRLADVTSKYTQLNPLTAEEKGAQLLSIRAKLKADADIAKNALYKTAQDAADAHHGGDGANFDVTGIDGTANRALSNPILAYDATNTPAVVAKIKEVTSPQAGVPAAPSLLSQGVAAPAAAPAAAAGPMTVKFADIKAMREAVNQDIATELASTNPNKRQRLRALTEIKQSIDGAVNEGPYQDVRTAFQAATDHYKYNYSPMFNRGINAKLAMQDATGERKIFDEKVLDQYIANPTNARNFTRLFGQNPEAMALMGDHLTDRLAAYAVKDGVLDPKRAALWLDKRKDQLDLLQQSGLGSIKDLRQTPKLVQYLSDKRANLMSNEKQIADEQLANLLGIPKDATVGKPTLTVDQVTAKALADPASMNRLTEALGQEGSKALASSVMRDAASRFTYAPGADKIGIDTAAFGKWLDENRVGLKVMFRAAYGAEEGPAHLTRLENAYHMMTIQDRLDSNLPSHVVRATDVGKDWLLKKVGVSTRTFFNLTRAVIGGRTSEADMALVLGGQMGSTYMQKVYNEMMQSIATDPESSKMVLELARGGGKKMMTPGELAAQRKAMQGLLAKAGYYYMGGKYYGPSAKQIALGFANDQITEDQQRKGLQ